MEALQLDFGLARPAGLARAGPGPLLGQSAGVEYRALGCRSVLNRVEGQRMAGFFSLNPYRGCEFACVYCYARYTHQFLDLGVSEDFERQIHVKLDAPRIFARDLHRVRVGEQRISFGSACDPYQPAERRFGVTRALLERLLPLRGLSIGVVTKSALVSRDAPLLAELSRRHRVEVLVSLITLDAALQRSLEPRAPTPEARLEALARLRDGGVSTGLLLAPVLPGLTDSADDLAALCRRAREAGAGTLHHQTVFLPRASRPRFFAWLERHRPDLLPRYRSAFSSGAEGAEAFGAGISARISRARGDAGL